MPRVCVSACAYVLARVGVHLHTCVCGFMRVSQRTNLDVCLRLLTFKDRVSLLFFFLGYLCLKFLHGPQVSGDCPVSAWYSLVGVLGLQTLVLCVWLFYSV